MKTMRKFVTAACLLFLLLFIGENATAQQRFKAGALLGVNASQIQNDDVGGYHRPGIQGGLRAVVVLADRYDVYIEMLYSQRGSYDKDGNWKCFNGDLDIFLQYIEVPVVFNYKDWLDEEKGYYKIQASGGFSYGRLISARAEGSCHDGVDQNFNRDDISVTVGAEYFASEKLSFGARWTRSLNRLYSSPAEGTNSGLASLRGYFLSFRSVYLF
jgi:hypothetical protein